MTGTADTEAFEFSTIYNLETVLIPTHRPMVRKDLNDQVFITAKEKQQAIINDIKERTGKGQPILVGTTSVEASELLSGMLEKEKIPHNVLNAKQHAREAEIVAQAGRPAQVTIATNMAGRGTDIVLGGNPDPEIQGLKADETLVESERERRIADVRESWQKLHNDVVSAGGLHIIGSERHESRRIDNQLRGRSGRQGDPGSSRFFLSFEDPLLKIFAGERLQAIMRSLKIPEGEAIEARMVTRSIENAQRKVEARNFDIRKQLLEFDDVANDQRKVIYAQRNELLESKEISETIGSIRADVLGATVAEFVPPDSVEEQWDLPSLEKKLEGDFFVKAPVKEWADADSTLDGEKIAHKLNEIAAKDYQAKFAPIDAEVLHNYERAVMLQSIDVHWREHLAALDYLRQGIHLRGYAQRQPKQEYKREAFELFGSMLDSIKREVTRHLMAVQVRSQAEVEEAERRAEEAARALKNVQYQHADFSPGVGDEAAEQIPPEVAAPPQRQPPPPRHPRNNPSSAPPRRSGATIPVPADRARSSSSATGSFPRKIESARGHHRPTRGPRRLRARLRSVRGRVRLFRHAADAVSLEGALAKDAGRELRGGLPTPRVRRRPGGRDGGTPSRGKVSAPGACAHAGDDGRFAVPGAGRRQHAHGGAPGTRGQMAARQPHRAHGVHRQRARHCPLQEVRLRDRRHPQELRAARREICGHTCDGPDPPEGRLTPCRIAVLPTAPKQQWQ
jgi:preprotein translocase subunit SecA